MAKTVTLYPVVWTTIEIDLPDTKFGPDLRGPFPVEYHYEIFDNEADARALYKDLAANEKDLVKLKIEKEDRFIDGKKMGGMTQTASSKNIEIWEYPADVGKDDDERKLAPRDKVVRVYKNSMMGSKRFPPKEDYVTFLGKKNRELKSMFKEMGFEDPFLKRKEAMKNMEEAKDAFSGYFSKTNLGQMIIDAEEILASGMQNGEPLDNETEMLVRQELERLKQLYIDNHGYTGMMATAEPNNKKEKVMKFLKSKKAYRENMNLESIYEDLKENEGQGKTISLYPFYNEELAQKLFAMGINDGNDWDDFLVKKLGGYWVGDPEGDGTMMYNVQEPLYSELRDKIKVLLKRIMTDTLEEGQLNEWTLGYDYPSDPDGECVSNGYVDFDITFAVKGWPSGRETVPASEFEAFVKEANTAITDYFKKQGAIQNLDIKNSLTLGDEYKDFDKEGDNYSFGSFVWKIQGDVEGIAAMEDEVVKAIAPKVKELAQNIQKYTWLDPSKIMIDDVESDLEYTC